MKVEFTRSYIPEKDWGRDPMAVQGGQHLASLRLLHQPLDVCRNVSGRKAACS